MSCMSALLSFRLFRLSKCKKTNTLSFSISIGQFKIEGTWNAPLVIFEFSVKILLYIFLH